MNRRRIWWILPLIFLPTPLLAQDAHSLGIGGAAAAAPMEIFGLYWNPAQLALPLTNQPVNPNITIGSGVSAFDTSNTSSPILQFNPQSSSPDPVKRYQQYLGIFAVKYMTMAGGAVYDQELSYTASQGALAFFRDRDSGFTPGKTYNLNYEQTKQQLTNVAVSYSTPLPIGTVPFFSVGGTLKYHIGLLYQQTSLNGSFESGNTTLTQKYVKYSSSSGLGYSVDAGIFAKLTDSIQAGLMLENLQSNFNWQAQKQTISLNPTTGAETPITSNVSLSVPFPYATKLGMVLAPQDKNTLLEGQVAWSQGQTRWRFGLEQFNPATYLVLRLGTYADEVSGDQLWTFGVGYDKANVNIDLALVTRSLPDVTGSVALGGALDAAVRF